MLGFIGSRDVRPSSIAGSWYPGRREQLQTTVDDLMDRAARPLLPGKVVGLVSPHAGYPYSGAIAAHAYAQIRGASYDTVVLLGPDHRGICGAYGISAYKHFQTPLGTVEVDLPLVERLQKRLAIDRIEDEEEHSLEIQLPFLQRTLGTFSLLPIMMGYPLMPRVGHTAWKACEMLSNALIEVLADRQNVLVVASTDLSHLYSYHEVVEHDQVFMTLIQELDPQRLADALIAGECQACGGAPVVTMMMTVKARGADKVTVLAYANSGDVTGNRVVGNYTVGYAAIALTATQPLRA